jgi:signal transduction histidine kinase
VQRDAKSPRQNYSQPVNRPLSTALGWNLPDWLLDYGPIAFIALEGTIAIFVGEGQTEPRYRLAIWLVINLTALLYRRRASLVTLGVTLAVALGVGYGPVVVLPVLLALFTVAEYEDRSTVIAAAILSAIVVIASPAAHGHVLDRLPEYPGRIVPIGLAVAAGLYIRARADYVNGLHERAERLERERQLLAREAVADERVRIARELHDVVAHNVSLMVVQSQALGATGADERQQAALRRVADLGREALSEMHRMLGVLRVEGGSAQEREPQPGVRDLDTLIARTREAGLRTSLTIAGPPRELSPGVELSVYRIAQEALTNVVRHANAERATVTLTYGPSALELQIVDDGTGQGVRTNGSAPGHGLLGMRERVALFGGQLTAGPGPEGRGYQVDARLPLA